MFCWSFDVNKSPWIPRESTAVHTHLLMRSSSLPGARSAGHPTAISTAVSLTGLI